MRTLIPVTLTAALLLAGCGGAENEQAAAEAPAASPAAAAPAAAADAPATRADAPSSQPSPSAEGGQTAEPAPPAIPRTRRLDTFDEDAVVWAMYHWAGAAPPLRQWAESKWRNVAHERKVNVDEFFDREAFIDELAAEMNQPYRAAADIGMVSILLQARLGSYDAQFQEFYLEPFSPGRTVRAYSKQVEREAQVHMVNALDAYAWSLTPEEAAAVVEGFEDRFGRRHSRDILVEAQLRLVGADVDPHSGNGRLRTEIVSYRVYRNEGGAAGGLLHSATLVGSGSGEPSHI